jgi:leucyl aminopeptidase
MTSFYSRYYKGSYAASSAQWMYSTVVDVASANTAITVKQFTHSYNQPSVIATIPGNSTEVVVVSAHYDSIGSTTNGKAPGGDDNASVSTTSPATRNMTDHIYPQGIIVILEALRVLANAKYKGGNTLEFHFYSGR